MCHCPSADCCWKKYATLLLFKEPGTQRTPAESCVYAKWAGKGADSRLTRHGVRQEKECIVNKWWWLCTHRSIKIENTFLWNKCILALRNLSEKTASHRSHAHTNEVRKQPAFVSIFIYFIYLLTRFKKNVFFFHSIHGLTQAGNMSFCRYTWMSATHTHLRGFRVNYMSVAYFVDYSDCNANVIPAKNCVISVLTSVQCTDMLEVKVWVRVSVMREKRIDRLLLCVR